MGVGVEILTCISFVTERIRGVVQSFEICDTVWSALPQQKLERGQT